MTYDFSGKTAVVTGASRGLGEAIVRTLAEDGARVILVARSGEKLRALADSLPNDATVIEADLAKKDSAKTLASSILAVTDKIDILVNNAGVGAREAIEHITPEALDFVMDVN
ncbi:MAG: SDR family oxidoreductase, partial [Henriciella sp.]